MSGAAVHDAGLPPASATIVRKIERLTKDRAKELVAAGIHRNSMGGALDQLALAGGCSKRCLEKAMAHETLPSLDVLLNALDFAPTLLDEVLKARGFRLAALEAAPSADLRLSAGLADVLGAFCEALSDGRRDHNETLVIASKLRGLMPALESIIREADAVRGLA